MLLKIDGAWWETEPLYHSDPAEILETLEETLAGFTPALQNEVYSLFC